MRQQTVNPLPPYHQKIAQVIEARSSTRQPLAGTKKPALNKPVPPRPRQPPPKPQNDVFSYFKLGGLLKRRYAVPGTKGRLNFVPGRLGDTTGTGEPIVGGTFSFKF